jgi:hypothetical protein
MMTTLVCTKCGDPIEVTDRSIVLPFVCDGCQNGKALLEAVDEVIKQQGGVLDPDSTLGTQVPEGEDCSQCDLKGPHGHLIEVVPDTTTAPSEDYASIENTIELVADLEKQLQAYKEAAERGNQAVAKLRAIAEAADRRCLVIRQEKEELAKQTEDLGVESFEKGKVIARLLGKCFEAWKRMTEAEAWEMRLHAATYKLIQRVEVAEGERDLAKNEAILVRMGADNLSHQVLRLESMNYDLSTQLVQANEKAFHLSQSVEYERDLKQYWYKRYEALRTYYRVSAIV